MDKVFALVAIVFGADGVGASHVLDHSLAGSDCIAMIEQFNGKPFVLEKTKDGLRLPTENWRELVTLNEGDLLSCELIVTR